MTLHKISGIPAFTQILHRLILGRFTLLDISLSVMPQISPCNNSRLYKTEGSRQLRTRSHKMNLLDIFTISPHYFCSRCMVTRYRDSSIHYINHTRLKTFALTKGQRPSRSVLDRISSRWPSYFVKSVDKTTLVFLLLSRLPSKDGRCRYQILHTSDSEVGSENIDTSEKYRCFRYCT